ncbi:hypothetical protein LEP1GSC199_2682 [Leptospira vanthielii serovar Holland str. Waz Holland = ATCC 700522]|uniref:Uncharacterized protein n=1 Tax=Leptospira vanthielii serovar Holland str. Waz Holland = ATCC 700522 TaxID=1218591 RepID=N1W221_9LEPT|nr:hypothetical protein LEP1GSC199_2682 [Leptospira vanthielii serovar Holland str. Waz Holland = ATCC 700522]
MFWAIVYRKYTINGLDQLPSRGNWAFLNLGFKLFFWF